MVSIEQIQRANSLSKELKKHGFAADNTQAYAQAEQIFDPYRESPEVEIASGDQVLIQKQAPEEELSEVQQRIKNLERYKDYSKSKLIEQKEQFAELIGKLNEMIKSINLIEMNQVNFEKRLKEVSNPDHKSESQASAPEQSQQESSPDNSKNLTEPIDRTGFAPADVAVDKIFYVGTK